MSMSMPGAGPRSLGCSVHPILHFGFCVLFRVPQDFSLFVPANCSPSLFLRRSQSVELIGFCCTWLIAYAFFLLSPLFPSSHCVEEAWGWTIALESWLSFSFPWSISLMHPPFTCLSFYVPRFRTFPEFYFFSFSFWCTRYLLTDGLSIHLRTRCHLYPIYDSPSLSTIRTVYLNDSILSAFFVRLLETTRYIFSIYFVTMMSN